MKPGVYHAQHENLDYLVRLYDKTLDWYKIADTKGQLLLTLNGVFITVVATTVFDRPQDLGSRLAAAGSVGLVLVLLSAACLAGSLLSTVICLYSRLSDSHLKRLASQEFGVNPADPTTYRPVIAGWFGFIASVSSAAQQSAGSAAANHMPEYLQTIDRGSERQMLAAQVVALSKNVLIKHRWVDRAWFLAGCALLGLIGFGVAYTSGV